MNLLPTNSKNICRERLVSPTVNTVTSDSPICYDELKDKKTKNMLTSQANRNENL